VLELKQRLPDLKQLAASSSAEPEETISIAAQAEERPKPSRRAPVKSARRATTRRPSARKAKRRV